MSKQNELLQNELNVIHTEMNFKQEKILAFEKSLNLHVSTFKRSETRMTDDHSGLAKRVDNVDAHI